MAGQIMKGWRFEYKKAGICLGMDVVCVRYSSG